MKKMIIGLILVMLLVPVSCAAPPAPSPAIKPLTGSEKNAMVITALAHPEVSKWLETAEVYGIEIGWSIVSWNNSEATGWASVAYEEIADGSFPPAKSFPPESTSIHPAVLLRLRNPPRMHIHIAFDRKTMEVVAVQFLERPATGPTPTPAPAPPPVSSPGYPNHGINTTDVEPRPGESGTIVSGSMVRYTIDDLVEKSDTVLIGKVVDIFPSRQVDRPPWIVITDVVIEVERYLYGQSQSTYIAVMVPGGRTEEMVVRVSDQPVFNLGEEVALFLYLQVSGITPPGGFNRDEYYMVTGSIQGKPSYSDDIMVTWEGERFTVSEVEQKIASIHGGE
jgi:hypothetical protein